MAAVDVQTLRSIGLFSFMDQDELNTLASHLDQVDLLAGKLVFKAGEQGGKMYLVERGKVELFVQDKADERVCLGFVGAGGLFGELSLLDGKPRSASAKAIENTRLIAIDQEDLMLLVKSHPAAALDMMAALGQRIRDSNELVRERVAVRNANDEMPTAHSFGDRLSDILTAIAGDIRFVYVSLLWFVVWIIWNMGLIPGVTPFDPYPFGMLTTVVSLEAIFLSLFVLISQNRQAAREKIRNDIEYEVNIKAEFEIRQLAKQIEEMQDTIASHFTVLHAQTQEVKPADTTQPSSVNGG